MASAHDVASYILKSVGPLSAMKLQKLVYYSQAWSLVWDDSPIFEERIEAWANGPVCPELYNLHKGKFVLDEWPHGDASRLEPRFRETIDAVIEYYNQFEAYQLSRLTHAERPWIEAREGLEPGERGNSEITHASMAEYYGSL